MPFRICSGNDKILIFHLTFCDAIKANVGPERKAAALLPGGRVGRSGRSQKLRVEGLMTMGRTGTVLPDACRRNVDKSS